MRPVNLSQQQWNAIRKVGGLPDQARQKIEQVLTNYRTFQDLSARQPRAGQTRSELLQIAKLAKKLTTAIIGEIPGALRRPQVKADVLAALMLPTSRPPGSGDKGVPRTSAAIIGSHDPARRHPLELLYGRVLAVEQLQTWFETAARSLPKETKGAHRAAENHQWLVRQLDAILTEYTDRRVSRSYKDDDLRRYLELCFAAADPSVGSGSITKAVEIHVRRNPRSRTTRAQSAKKKRA
jgi:hypothetical protein